MKFKIAAVIAIVVLLSPLALMAQSENIWAFGFHAGLDFTNGSPVPIRSGIEGFGEGQASVCDPSGQLMFYTEGTKVWDRNHNIMPNGQDITGVVSTTSYTATSSTSQGTLIMLVPGTTQKYYIFSLTSMEQNSMGNAGKLFYTIVDMGLNNGLGDVVQGQKGILIDGKLSERLTAVVGNRCNIWVLTSSMDGKIQAYEVTHSGVSNEPVVSSVGIEHEFAGYLVVSPDRKKLLGTKCFQFGASLRAATLFDFDVNTGLASNPLPLLDGKGGYGACFSPDNSKVYIATDFSDVYQFDLSSGSHADILASETLVGESTMTGMKLGPDGRIYLNSRYGGSLDAIKFPNLKGTACEYTQREVTLVSGTNCISGLPNDVPIFTFFLDTSYTSQTMYATCITQSFPLVASDNTGWDYTWNTGETGRALSVNRQGVYWVKYFTAPCTYRVDTFNVYFPTLEIKNSCNNGANGAAWIIIPEGDTLDYSFSWQDTAGKVLSTTDSLINVLPGRYQLHISSLNGCDVVVDVIIENDQYDASFIADSLICEGTELQFENTSESFFNEFVWLFGEEGESANRNPSHIFMIPGENLVTLIAKNDDCTDTFTKAVFVDSITSGSFRAEPAAICLGEAIEFTTRVDSLSTLNLTWDFGDGIKMTGANEGKVSHAYDKSGNLSVTLSAQFRVCPDVSYQDTIQVYDFPSVDLGNERNLCLNGSPVLLRNLRSKDAMGHKYLWSTGDTTETLKVLSPGTYTLTLTNGLIGCSTTESVEVLKDCYIDIPNAFTPNGDGENDYFFPRQLLSKNVTKFKMQIFNRWGQTMFETSNLIGRGWDGRFNDKDQPVGVYVYKIELEIDGTRIENYEGNVTLLK